MWLGLMIGNSRLHWGLFVGEGLCCAWDTSYLSADVVRQLAGCRTVEDLRSVINYTRSFPAPLPKGGWGVEMCDNYKENWDENLQSLISPLPLVLASVVPSETAVWQSYLNVRIATLNNVPLSGLYPTLGIDRALALWGAGQVWGFPMLVIDAGTALTFTGADCNDNLVGGAILPGLGLQFATLAGKTGQLPSVDLPEQLPRRYAVNTQEAMQSGVIYTLLAGIKDFVAAWWQDFPESNVAITGGDRTLLINYLQSQFPKIANSLIVEPNLIFLGMRSLTLH
ncbi:pantothenate kinase [Iningainema sp. BLCCT55]|uniref:Type III pantothenate kinase n=2 Tax=Iningainema TaxID=1932705 RepID=A0A8J6XHQ0_9CYAN|nr:pantothenate kinase [Iningainema tapete BLCC-T55]